MMAAEISGGLLFGSIALVADGMHMSTHAGALLLAAVAYRYARRHARDDRFSFGTGKIGDLAGFTSAIILMMIALLIGYEALMRLLHPVSIGFGEAIPIAAAGLVVNIVSAWLLSGGHDHGRGGARDHDHGVAPGCDHEHGHGRGEGLVRVRTSKGAAEISIFEQDSPPRFRLRLEAQLQGPSGATACDPAPILRTERRDGAVQTFVMIDHGAFWQSLEGVPEPHEFTVRLDLGDVTASVAFEEVQEDAGSSRPTANGHGHDHGHADHNMRAALGHVLADAAVSVLVIAGLILARALGWIWMDPVAGLVGAAVIVTWALGLIRDTGAILLDMTPRGSVGVKMRHALEADGDVVSDLHIWRVGPGHMAAIASVVTRSARTSADYRRRLRNLSQVSHLTIEVERADVGP